jgi:hypothetical protein
MIHTLQMQPLKPLMPDNAPIPAVATESLMRKHETSDRNPRNVLIIAVSAVGLIVLSLIIAGIAAIIFSARRPMQSMRPLGILTAPNLQPLARFPQPHLAVDDDHAQKTVLRAAQIAKLNSYGWVDRSNGIVHIPIDRAMDLILQNGLPTRTNGSPALDSSPLQLIQRIPEHP